MRNRGFTLIELLVVIAIIAILAATLMPSYSTTNDRANVAECKSNLTAIYLAIQMWVEDHGSRPETLEALYDRGYITDDTMLRCTKTGSLYYYNAEAGKEEIMCADVAPDTPTGKRPHSFRQSFVALYGGGKMEEIGRKTNSLPDYGFENQ
ncbi:MAG: prepilin-type N-terminal cleavage/methylation domain-containing protein [Armatimonadota bacterium]